MQLLALALLIFILALAGVFYPYNRGSLFTALIMLYALTAGIAGYTAASCYRQFEGGSWLKNLLVTCLIYLGPFCLVFSFNNTVARVYGVSCLACPTDLTASSLCTLMPAMHAFGLYRASKQASKQACKRWQASQQAI